MNSHASEKVNHLIATTAEQLEKTILVNRKVPVDEVNALARLIEAVGTEEGAEPANAIGFHAPPVEDEEEE